MNREFKFRAWDVVNKKMRDCFNGHIDFEHFMNINSPWHDEKTERYTVMQFTGLRDKNGKEIFEGDIIKTSTSPASTNSVKGDVVWYRASWMVNINKTNRHVFSLTGYCEVVGNIYENPELLEQ